MVDKRVFVLEDYLQMRFMEDLFGKYKGRGRYELITQLDLSDDRVYQRHLPEGFDVYWLHSSAVEFDAIDEIREIQNWSKIVVRSAMKEVSTVEHYLKSNKIDEVLSSTEGLEEKKVLEILLRVGINLYLEGATR